MKISKRRAAVLIGMLSVQAALLYGFRIQEVIPNLPAFPALPRQMGSWEMVEETELDQATKQILRPDISVSRTYADPSRTMNIGLFAGYFKTTQANAPAPHSPKICLPGAGWRGIYSKEVIIPSTHTGGAKFVANEYLLEKGTQKILVYYWYQNSERTWSDEVMAKVYILPDLIRHQRSEVALLRVIVRLQDENLDAAREAGKDFTAAFEEAARKAFATRTVRRPS